MAEGARFTSLYIEEVQSGVTPATPVFNVFRTTGSGLDINVSVLESDEIRDDAEYSDVRLGTRHVEGTASAELSFGTYDELIASALRSEWVADVVKGAIARRSFTFVDYNADILDKPYTIYRGCEINTVAIKVSAEAMTTIEFGIVGRTMESALNLPTGATVLPRTTTSPMDGFSGSLLQDGVEIATVTEITITLENGIAPRFVVGSKFSIKPGATRRSVTAAITSYFEDNVLRDKFLNETEIALTVGLVDPVNEDNAYAILLPRGKITEAARPIDGEGDIMLNMTMRALLSPTTGSSIQITRTLAEV